MGYGPLVNHLKIYGPKTALLKLMNLVDTLAIVNGLTVHLTLLFLDGKSERACKT